MWTTLGTEVNPLIARAKKSACPKLFLAVASWGIIFLHLGCESGPDVKEVPDDWAAFQKSAVQAAFLPICSGKLSYFQDKSNPGSYNYDWSNCQLLLRTGLSPNILAMNHPQMKTIRLDGDFIYMDEFRGNQQGEKIKVEEDKNHDIRITGQTDQCLRMILISPSRLKSLALQWRDAPPNDMNCENREYNKNIGIKRNKVISTFRQYLEKFK